MSYYEIQEKEQIQTSWVMHDFVKKKRGGVRSNWGLQSFLGPIPDGEVRMKEKFLRICCPKCGRYDEDDAFDIGFDEPVTIRIKGDFAGTSDRIFIVSDKFVNIVTRNKIGGFVSKPIGNSGWNAFNITFRVDCADDAIVFGESFCPACGRPDRIKGSFRYEKQLVVPDVSNSFFTTRKNWHHIFMDRDIFMDEKTALILKENGISGLSCYRLFTEEERRKIERIRVATGKSWTPSKAYIKL